MIKIRVRLAAAFLTSALLFSVIILFTLVDYFVHGLFPEWAVPGYYFRNKIIFGFIYGAILIFIVLKINNLLARAFVFSFLLAAALQFRYFIEGYDLTFVLTFFFIHFAILFVLSAPMFYLLGKNVRIGQD